MTRSAFAVQQECEEVPLGIGVSRALWGSCWHLRNAAVTSRAPGVPVCGSRSHEQPPSISDPIGER